MKKTRKVLALALAFVLTVSLSIAGTIAYLTDTDSAVNTMTVGNVDIEQTEWQRVINEDGENSFEPFVQDKLLMPGVYSSVNANWKVEYDAYPLEIADGAAWNGFWGVADDGYEWNGSDPVETYNAQDKIVVVQNTGNQPVYYRTILAVEKGAALHLNFNGNDKFEWNNYNVTGNADKDTAMFSVEINAVEYDVFVATYKPVLTVGEVSRPSLLQVMIDKEATNEDVALFGEDGITIHALSQAVQSAGFEDANVALVEAFGEVTAENVVTWFGTQD